MILAGTEIQAEVKAGNIEIDPFDEKNVNPASVDLTLGDEVAIYEGTAHFTGADPKRWPSSKNLDGSAFMPMGPTCPHVIDVRKRPEVRRFKISENGWVLQPGIGYLMHTNERVATNKYIPVLDGKSSIGRLFVWIHVTAGYGDLGFNGQYTLEVASLFPVRLYAGMRICQMRFHTVTGEPVNYQQVGHYTKDLARGAVPSQAWMQFGNGSPKA